MLLLSLLALALALPEIVLTILNLIKDPVLLPAVISAIMWVVNQYTSLLAKVPNMLKIVLMTVVPALLALGASKLGIDISSIQSAAAGLVAAGIFWLGQKKEQAAK